MSKNSPAIKLLDGAILLFFVLFLLSLSNSIFVNQIGLYLTFLLFLIRSGITHENPFSKTGLEFALTLYVVAELLSAVFSDYSAEAFNNVLKRILLFPVIYTTIMAVTDFKRGRLYFKIYIAGTMITVLLYLYFSYYYVINNLYGQTQSGPSLFQYPITASEILSFTVIFLFAFLVNEKTDWKYKLLLLAGFGLSCLSLVSTYKRTGWIGAAFGILIILIIKKQWKILIAGVVIVLIAFVWQENISKVVVYDDADGKIVPAYSITTEGRAYQITDLEKYYAVSDFENGLSIYKDSMLIKNIKLAGQVKSFKHINDNFYLTYLEDTRFIILKKKDLMFEEVNEFMCPGYTKQYRIANGYVYVIDSDSGLTVFNDPLKNNSNVRYAEYSNQSNLFVDSSFLIFSSADSGFTVISLANNLPGELLYKNNKPGFEKLFYSNGKILAAYSDGLFLYNVDFSGVEIEQVFSSVKGIYKISEDKKDFIIVNTNGDVSRLIIKEYGQNSIKLLTRLNFLPKAVTVSIDRLYFSQVKRSRLLGIFDPYHPSNYTRLALWRAGWKMFKDYPVFGVGDIDLAKYYLKYKRKYDKEILGHMHNNFIHFLVTLGIFGLLVLCYLFYKIISIDLKIMREVRGKPFMSSYAIGALASFGAVLASGLTELNFWDQEITTLIYFVFGLNLALFQSFKKETKLPTTN